MGGQRVHIQLLYKVYLNKDTMSSPVFFKSSSGSIHRIAAFWNTYIAYFKKKQQQIITSNFLCLINTLKTQISQPIAVAKYSQNSQADITITV